MTDYSYDPNEINNLINSTNLNTTQIQNVYNEANNGDMTAPPQQLAEMQQQQRQQQQQAQINNDMKEMEDVYNKKDMKEEIVKVIKEMSIILIVYIILSQEQVKNFIGKYIKYINPNNEGKVEMSGIIIYGVLLSGIVVGINRYLLKNK